jgi:multiple sugar transport system ATP-binding protein
MNLVPRDDELLGFRPESFLPAALVDGGDRRVTAQFDVDRVEYLSGDRLIYGEVRGLGEQTRVISKLGATVDTPIEAGRVHEFALHERDLCRFDAGSGQRTEPRPAG